MSSPAVRLATEADLPAINDIYNYYVEHSTCTYQVESDTLDERIAWFRDHLPDRYPVTVVELDGKVLGWGSLSRFRPRAGYAPTVEASIYLLHGQQRRGLGKLVYRDLIDRARQIGYHSIIGGVSAEQAASVALHESLGFRRIAHLPEVGFKFDQWLDVIYFQLMLEPMNQNKS